MARNKSDDVAIAFAKLRIPTYEKIAKRCGMTVGQVKHILFDHGLSIRSKHRAQYTKEMRIIAEYVENESGVSLDEIRSGSRKSKISKAKRLFCGLCCEYDIPYSRIARFLKMKCHSSIIYQVRKYNEEENA